jgi:hypothetical protein
MPRYRLIPTGVPTSSDLQQTLTDMGLRNVEFHAAPVPLNDWIGRPTDVMANVIVRRKDIGASSDDMGFVRNSAGTWDALISEMHLFRFDKKWFADLSKRSGTIVPTQGPRQFADSSSSPIGMAAAAAVTRAASTARDDGREQRARLAAAEVLDKARHSQKLGRVGCLLFFFPLLPWGLMTAASGREPQAIPLLIGWAAWTVVWFIGVLVVLALRFQSRVREFAQRFPRGSEGRAAAIAQLRSVAEDKKNEATGIAQRLLGQLEKSAAVRLTQRPPTPRGPGAPTP